LNQSGDALDEWIPRLDNLESQINGLSEVILFEFNDVLYGNKIDGFRIEFPF
jgi:hypothetical protein